jgi:hypothetical protein
LEVLANGERLAQRSCSTPVLEGASPVIATLLGEVFVWDAFHVVARLHPMPIANKASR